MSIKSRIWLFQLIATAAVVTMAAATYFGVRAANDYLSREQLSHKQLDMTTQLAVHANRFSEQIAELLLIGEPERSDFVSARDQTSAAIAELRTITIRELEMVGDAAEKEEEQRELARLNVMRTLFREIDRAVERVLLLNQQGRRNEAIALFRSEIENRLDADFEKLIADAVSDERQEVESAEAEARLLSQQLLTGTLVLLAGLLAAFVGSGFLFARSLDRPIKALTVGAQAIERGHLDHRIAYSGRDELGLLAERFNAMADVLRRQRQELEGARARLEHDVTERTRELGEVNRRLTELDQQRVKLLADISHELKTPLTVLRGEAEVTLRGNSRSQSVYRKALTRIAAQAVDMGRLVDDLLFLARTEVDEVRFDFRPVPMNELVSEAVGDVAVLAGDRDIAIAVDGADKDPIIHADPRRLKQAIIIVLDNAIKYADANSTVRVGLGATGGHARISIRNAGQVIGADELPHVFERFYRAANAGESGSGLGLAIAQWIVGKHDGQIDMSSSAREGTEVRIRLPQAGPA